MVFHSFQRTLPLRVGQASCHPPHWGAKSQQRAPLGSGRRAQMVLPEAGWGRGEALAIPESCWDPFKVPWSFRQPHLDGNHFTILVSFLLSFLVCNCKTHENLLKYSIRGPDMMVILFLSIQEAGVSPDMGNRSPGGGGPIYFLIMVPADVALYPLRPTRQVHSGNLFSLAACRCNRTCSGQP